MPFNNTKIKSINILAIIGVINKIIYLLAIVVGIFSCFLIIFPSSNALLPLQYILFFTPRYFYFFVVLYLCFQWRKATNIKKIILTSLMFISIYLLDIQININTQGNAVQKSPTFTLVSANIGEGIELSHLMSVIKFHNPDIFTLQEASRITNIDKLAGYPFQDCKGNLCLISKYPFKKVNSLNNDMFKGYGDWSAFYEIDINGTLVNIVNVHFPSVRSIFPRFYGIKNIHQNRVLSALLIDDWAQSKKNVIIAGDFNMSVTEGTYQRTFTKYLNALSHSGTGFNNTVDYKYRGFSLPGIRIDHILLSQEFNIQKAIVLETLGGDHYPILSKIAFKEH